MARRYIPLYIYIPYIPSPLPGDIFITPAALHKIVIRLSKKKALGPDGISTPALRHFLRRAIVAMNRVFDGILRTGHFPEKWKRGKIITIPKAGKDPRKPKNIRPITLLSHGSKQFERALLTKLRLFLTLRRGVRKRRRRSHCGVRCRSNTASAADTPQR
ncbi:Probable RNA-directed DNA polymerase from transposon X-element [Eumeta japonica]|uniref:Probable RNA-directed DNA polymerase from transposon X-element n=1 Tax=Eumeta variegata TaxID=151549 RepID=A0A4C1WSS7_EUMVA|nr:Probable RNA-directed DNA polymerase from transposon X-element [Eumeta japonica]